MSIREISRRTGLARNTVKKYLRSDETEPNYERRVSSSKLDPYAEKLAIWLGVEATKSRKQRRTLRQIHTAEHSMICSDVQNSGLIVLIRAIIAPCSWPVNIEKTLPQLPRNKLTLSMQ